MFRHITKKQPTNYEINQIVTAIEGRLLLSAVYNGQRRILEPHTVGRASTGNVLLRAWQVSGGSNSGHPTGWKLMIVSDLEIVSANAGTFSSARDGYKRRDKAMRTIIAEL